MEHNSFHHLTFFKMAALTFGRGTGSSSPSSSIPKSKNGKMTEQLADKTIYWTGVLHQFFTILTALRLKIGNKGPLNCEVRSFCKAVWSYGCVIHPRLYQAEVKWLIRLPHQMTPSTNHQLNCHLLTQCSEYELRCRTIWQTFVNFYHLHSFNPQVLTEGSHSIND